MSYSKEWLQKELSLKQFPLSSKYDVEWLYENEMGPCSVWLSEFLLEKLEIKEGMKVLDLGCGKAMSSIFIAKEYGAKVWATDLWIDATDNYRRIMGSNVEDLVCPINAEAHNLPYAKGFFDVIVSLDAYHYFGTNEMYLEDIVRYLKPNGKIGIVVPGVKKELNGVVPESIKPYWEPSYFTFHSAEWWKKLWIRSELIDVEVADEMPNGYENWLKWDKTLEDAGILKRNGDIEMLKADGGNFTFVRIIGKKI